MVVVAASSYHITFPQHHPWLSGFQLQLPWTVLVHQALRVSYLSSPVCLPTFSPRAASDAKRGHSPMSTHSLEVLPVIISQTPTLTQWGTEASPQILQPPIIQCTILGDVFENFSETPAGSTAFYLIPQIPITHKY